MVVLVVEAPLIAAALVQTEVVHKLAKPQRYCHEYEESRLGTQRAAERGLTCESHVRTIEWPSGDRACIEAECAIIIASGVFSACLSRSKEGWYDGKEAPMGTLGS